MANHLKFMVGTMGLEPRTSTVSGRSEPQTGDNKKCNQKQKMAFWRIKNNRDKITESY